MRETFQVSPGVLLTDVHPALECLGRSCVVHNPSDHHMRGWTMVWRGDRGMIERLCHHGIGHPDPDDVSYHVDILGELFWGIHGCDGCCRRPEDPA